MLNNEATVTPDAVFEGAQAVQSATKPAAKKKAAKNPAAKKVVAEKPAAKKTESVAKSKAARKSVAKKAVSNSPLYMAKDKYKELIAGLMDQGLEHGDAVETMKVGLREANGIPVPAMLRNVGAPTKESAAPVSANDAAVAMAA